jgi:hypothetical protein
MGLGLAAGDVAGGDQDFRLLPVPPEILDERRAVGQVGIHGDDIAGLARRNGLHQGRTISRPPLLDGPGAPACGRLDRPVPGSAVRHNDLPADPQAVQRLPEGREEEFQVLPLVPRGDQDGEIWVRGPSAHRDVSAWGTCGSDPAGWLSRASAAPSPTAL